MGDEDAEVVAIQRVLAALEGLDEGARIRVLQWAANRYGVNLSGRPVTRHGGMEGRDDTAAEFEHFADLFDAANPSTEDDRALVGGYWFQVVQRESSFTGRKVNDTLKDTGHGVSNVARSFESLQKRSPAAARQVSKSGRSRQARKTYKLTVEGIRSVERMIRGDAAEGEGDTS
jgi:hypothetical protein